MVHGAAPSTQLVFDVRVTPSTAPAKPGDPLAILWATGILMAALIVAGYAPAMRASRIDPLTALRHE